MEMTCLTGLFYNLFAAALKSALFYKTRTADNVGEPTFLVAARWLAQSFVYGLKWSIKLILIIAVVSRGPPVIEYAAIRAGSDLLLS